MKHSILFFLVLSFANCVWAEDLGFRYNGSACVDQTGKTGLNPSFFGQCGDLRHVTINALNFDNTDFTGAVFDGADFQRSTFNNTNLTATSFVGTNLSGAALTGADIHQANFTQAILLNAHFAGADIKSTNFSGAMLDGGVFSTMTLAGNMFKGASLKSAALDGADLSNCDLSSANLSSANLQSARLNSATVTLTNFVSADLTGASLAAATGASVNFKAALLRQANLQNAKMVSANMAGAQMNQAVLTGGSFMNADLRRSVLTGATLDNANLVGALFNKGTILPISYDAAVNLGMRLDDTLNLLIIYDNGDSSLIQLLSAINAQGVQTTISTQADSQFDGTVDLTSYSAILEVNAIDYSTDMPAAGQAALVDFVQGGGIFIGLGTLTYAQAENLYAKMADLILLKYSTYTSSTLTLSTPANVTSPVLNGLKSPVTTTSIPYMEGSAQTFTANPVNVLMTDSNNYPQVLERDLGSGHVVQLAMCYPGQPSCLSDPTVAQLIVNAAKWDTSSATTRQ